MAQAKTDGKKEEEPTPTKGSKVPQWAIFVVALLATAVISAGSIYFLMKHKAKHAEVEEVVIKPAEAAQYLPIPDAFLVLLQPDKVDSTGKYLNIKITVTFREEEVKAILEKNMPLLKNDIIATLSKYTGEQALSAEGRAKMQTDVTAAFNKIVKGSAKDKSIENVYFIEFIVQ